MRAIIVAAGTGGHITPGISIANKIKREEPESKIIFIGTKNGMENDIVSKEGYEIRHIRAEGLKPGLDLDNIRILFNMLFGIGDAKKVIKEFKPDVVIGTGGYVSFPIFKVATKMKIPTLLHESNSIPGKVVKIMAHKVNTIMVGFKKTKENMKDADNVVYTGTPTKMLTYVPPINLKEKLGLKNDLPILLITGGSQGAKKLNENVIQVLNKTKDRKYQVIFVTGKNNYDYAVQNIKNKENVQIISYAYNMEEYMSVADVIISRAGALSLTEICIMGIPSIIIPFPYSAENHQIYNAQVLKDAGAGEVIIEEDLTIDLLKDTLEKIIYNKELLQDMRNKAKGLAVMDVEDVIYSEIKKAIGNC